MRPPFLLLLLCLLAPFASAADEEGFQSLFDGRTLAGWTGDPAIWTVEDGAITGRTTPEVRLPANSFLLWHEDVADFELRLEYRLIPGNNENYANSGIQYRSHLTDTDRWMVSGYQCDIDARGRFTGMFYEEKGRRFLARPGESVVITHPGRECVVSVVGRTGEPDRVAAAFRPGEWNELVIIADGSHFQHFINGVPTAEARDLDDVHAADSGLIGLQMHAGLPMTLQVRHIRLKKLR